MFQMLGMIDMRDIVGVEGLGRQERMWGAHRRFREPDSF